MSSYLGNIPSNNFVSLKRQVITGNGGASYTLDYSVASVNDVAIFVNNVRQDPASYSISTTSLTLGGTISSSDSCYIIFLGQGLQTVTPANNTITNAMIQDGTIAESKLASGVNTITMADQWRLSASLTGDHNPISTNLERVNNTGQGTIGTGMTESSGSFTFPQTGLYYVQSNLSFNSTANLSSMANRILIATDGSTYSTLSIGYGYVDTTSSARRYINVSTNAFINVTDTANIKVQFRISGASSATTLGSTSINYSIFNFIRLGDSV